MALSSESKFGVKALTAPTEVKLSVATATGLNGGQYV